MRVKRLLSLLLVIAMVFSMMPSMAMAKGNEHKCNEKLTMKGDASITKVKIVEVKKKEADVKVTGIQTVECPYHGEEHIEKTVTVKKQSVWYNIFSGEYVLLNRSATEAEGQKQIKKELENTKCGKSSVVLILKGEANKDDRIVLAEDETSVDLSEHKMSKKRSSVKGMG